MQTNRIVLAVIVFASVVSLLLPAIQIGTTSFLGLFAFAMSIGMLINPDAWGVVFSTASKDSFALHGGIANVLYIWRALQIYRNIDNTISIRACFFVAHSLAVLAMAQSDELTHGNYRIGFYIWIGSHIAFLAVLLEMETEIVFTKRSVQEYPVNNPDSED